jgi:uncharacterized protein YjbJ (UPF0337 family)
MAYIKSWQQFKGISDQLQEALKKRGGKLTDEDLLRIKIQNESVGGYPEALWSSERGG